MFEKLRLKAEALPRCTGSIMMCDPAEVGGWKLLKLPGDSHAGGTIAPPFTISIPPRVACQLPCMDA